VPALRTVPFDDVLLSAPASINCFNSGGPCPMVGRPSVESKEVRSPAAAVTSGAANDVPLIYTGSSPVPRLQTLSPGANRSTYVCITLPLVALTAESQEILREGEVAPTTSTVSCRESASRG
jgi:hypothetical protein